MSIENIGVVIIGRNEGERLVLCLESILAAKVPCVYVDSQSKDNSVAEAEKRGVTTVVLDDSLPINASRARNTGFDMLVGSNPSLNFVHFIDADCELDESWLEHAVGKLKSSKEVAIVCGRLREKHRTESIYMRLCDIDWFIKPGEVNRCGGIFTIRRKVFENMSGFDASLIAGADPELCFRIHNKGWIILVLDSEMGTHDSAMRDFYQWWDRCVKVGFGYANGASWGGWKKQYLSSLMWGAILPLIIVLGSLSSSLFFAALLGLYPFQVLKIYMSKLSIGSDSKYDKFLYALFCVIAKFPEAIGGVKFLIRRVKGGQQKIIEYKA
ncbi:MAG: glycosyltransferase family A protein [Gammaproteobacteria bacterium]